jgi:hypothetical protein
MLDSRAAVRWLALAGAASGFLAMGATGGTAPSDHSYVMSKLAPNGDALDVKEVEAAARVKFAELDTDHDELLDSNELTGVATLGELHAADADRDRALNKAEYLDLVKMKFDQADIDRDGLLDEKELSTQAGVDLVALLAY